MRIVLFTGKGGVGKSTVAAGSAALAAARGARTLVLSTDTAHSLADAFGVAVGPEPTEVSPGLFAQQVDTQLRFEQSWSAVRGYLLEVLDLAGLDPVSAEELSVLPGAEEVLALLELRRHALAEEWDAVLVDCAPSAETARLLALPEILGWYLRRARPERGLLRALGPALARVSGVPRPEGDVASSAERLRVQLAEVQGLLAAPDATVRIVLTPESVVLAEARRSWTTLSLFGYRVDGVVANRVFPAGPDESGESGESGESWRAGWVRAQEQVLADVERSFAPLPVWRSDYAPGEPVGVAALRELAEQLYSGADPLARASAAAPFRVSRTHAGAVLHLSLPLVARDEVDVARAGDELVVTVGSHRRVLALPNGLAGLAVTGASLEGAELQVRFGLEHAVAAGTGSP